MIVREYEDRFVLIEQDFHAQLSGEIMKHWKDDLFAGKEWRDSVEYAIANHDYGWRFFDREPFWNDAVKKPYSFIDFPVSPKTVLYTYGIDAVENEDRYAGLLCSSHYTRFIARENSKQAKVFVQAETKRQEGLMQTIPHFDEQLYQFHFGLVRFGDDISLYLCLNEPSTPPDAVHYFFKKGLNVSALTGFKGDYISLHFQDQHTLVIEEFPFRSSFTVTLEQKTILKERILAEGLKNSYQNTQTEKIAIHLTGN